jgi:hypothetical protein
MDWPSLKAKRLNWTVIGTLAVAVLAVRLCYLIVAYGSPGTTIRRPHIETAALLFAIVGFAFRFGTDVRGIAEPAPSPPPPWPLAFAFASVALLVYWPALFVGLLSDDFILVQHAADWNLRQVAPQLFRPLPLVVWGAVLHLGAGAKSIHVLNVLFHGANAYLASLIVAGWGVGARWATIAGLLVLAAPLGPEAVAWCSGAFDLFAAASLMGAVLVARRNEGAVWNHLLFAGLAIAAVLSKETAVVLPILLLLDGWIRSTMATELWLKVTISTLVVATFAVVRLQSAGTIGTLSRYRLQRLVFDSFGNLVAPWHVQLMASAPWLRPAIAVLVISLLTGFLLLQGPRRHSKVALGAAMWVLISVLPVITMFHVGPQLEGARYLYLAATGWAAVLVVAAREVKQVRPGAGVIAAAAVGTVLAAGVVGVRAHLVQWTHAATTRDLVIGAASADQRLHSCKVVYLQNLPESVGGAYVLANGAREAFSDVAVNAFVSNEPGACSFRWDPTISGFVRSSQIP